MLRLRSRNEDPLINLDVDVTETFAARQVGHRNAADAAQPDVVPKAPPWLARYQDVAIGQQPRAIDLERVRE